MHENYLAILSVTKKLGWFTQYSDYNIGWTALVLISLKAKITFFFLSMTEPPNHCTI
jgi:hypothetical protein